VQTRKKSDYFEVALDLLANEGANALTIARLCESLEVTKGSFYHHFSGTEDFYEKLLEYWEFEAAREIVDRVELIDDPPKRVESLKMAAVNLNHEAESAIRAWARTYEFAASTQKRVDAARVDVLTTAFIGVGVPPMPAGVLARIGVRILVGSQYVERPVDRKELRRLLDEYQRWVEVHSVRSGRGRRDPVQGNRKLRRTVARA
jgi:AcrR family transcriptional regulator